MTRILYIGTHDEIRATMLRLLNANENWEGQCAGSVDDAVAIASEKPFDLLLIGNGLSEAAENELKTIFSAKFPSTKTVFHYGGGSGLLKAEIENALR